MRRTASLVALCLGLGLILPDVPLAHELPDDPLVLAQAEAAEEPAASEGEVSERGLRDRIQQQQDTARDRRQERKQQREVRLEQLTERESSLVEAFRQLDWSADCEGAGIPLELARQVRQDPEGFVQAAVGQALDDVVARFDELMSEELSRLDAAQGHDVSAASVSGGGLAKLRAATRGRTRCLLDFAAEQWPEDARRSRLREQLVARFEVAGQALRERVEPRVRNAIAKGLQKLLTGEGKRSDLLTARELRAVANDVLVEHLVAKLDTAGREIDRLEHALGGNELAALGALETAHGAMTFRENPELAALQQDFAWAIVRAMGHKYIDNDEAGRGGYFVNQAIGLIQLSDGTVEKIASAVCGLVPEVGAAVCAIIAEGVDIAWNQVVVPAIEARLTGFLHAQLDAACDAARANARVPEGFEFLKDALTAGSGFMRGTLIQNLVDGDLKRILKAIDRYNGSVRSLGEEAASRI